MKKEFHLKGMPAPATDRACLFERPMSTAEPTLKSSAGSLNTGSAAANRKRGYIPGGPVAVSTSEGQGGRKRGRTVSIVPPKKRMVWRDLHRDIVDNIVLHLARTRQCQAVMTLSMVNRSFRMDVANNLKAWHTMYLHWRGHLSAGSNMAQRIMRNPPNSNLIRNPPNLLVKLNPTFPRSLPNFRDKAPSIA